MSKTSLEQVKSLADQLSSSDRSALVAHLCALPDSTVTLHVRDESESYYKANKADKKLRKESPTLVIDVGNSAAFRILGAEVFRVRFFPNNFTDNYNKMAVNVLEEPPPEIKRSIQSVLEEKGIESTEQAQRDVAQAYQLIMRTIFKEQASLIAEHITTNLQIIAGHVFELALKGYSVALFNSIAADSFHPEEKVKTSDIKKLLLNTYWKITKSNLGVTRGGNRRTAPEWNSEESVVQYARKVRERHPLALCIKDMYDDCMGDESWIEDLKLNPTFQQLRQGVPDEIIEWTIKRVANSEKVQETDREPLSLSLEMARQELALPAQSIGTLRSYYSEGKKLLRQKTTKSTN